MAYNWKLYETLTFTVPSNLVVSTSWPVFDATDLAVKDAGGEDIEGYTVSFMQGSVPQPVNITLPTTVGVGSTVSVSLDNMLINNRFNFQGSNIDPAILNQVPGLGAAYAGVLNHHKEGQEGPAGPQGPQGADGPAGPAGPQGGEGPRGQAGEQGIQGADGPAGQRGQQGDAGGEGPRGPAGEDGQRGADGPRGLQGEQGIQGGEGPRGPIGETGARGADGPVGPEGPQGPAGPAGTGSGTADTAQIEADIDALEALMPSTAAEVIYNSTFTAAGTTDPDPHGFAASTQTGIFPTFGTIADASITIGGMTYNIEGISTQTGARRFVFSIQPDEEADISLPSNLRISVFNDADGTNVFALSFSDALVAGADTLFEQWYWILSQSDYSSFVDGTTYRVVVYRHDEALDTLVGIMEPSSLVSPVARNEDITPTNALQAGSIADTVRLSTILLPTDTVIIYDSEFTSGAIGTQRGFATSEYSSQFAQGSVVNPTIHLLGVDYAVEAILSRTNTGNTNNQFRFAINPDVESALDIPDDYHIDVFDGDGRTVYSLSFSDALIGDDGGTAESWRWMFDAADHVLFESGQTYRCVVYERPTRANTLVDLTHPRRLTPVAHGDQVHPGNLLQSASIADMLELVDDTPQEATLPTGNPISLTQQLVRIEESDPTFPFTPNAAAFSRTAGFSSITIPDAAISVRVSIEHESRNIDGEVRLVVQTDAGQIIAPLTNGAVEFSALSSIRTSNGNISLGLQTLVQQPNTERTYQGRVEFYTDAAYGVVAPKLKVLDHAIILPNIEPPHLPFHALTHAVPTASIQDMFFYYTVRQVSSGAVPIGGTAREIREVFSGDQIRAQHLEAEQTSDLRIRSGAFMMAASSHGLSADALQLVSANATTNTGNPTFLVRCLQARDLITHVMLQGFYQAPTQMLMNRIEVSLQRPH